MLTGLSAFPLTPMRDDAVAEAAFARLIERLAQAGVDSITALGSTGSYAYLNPEERARVAALAVAHANSVPVIVGVGGLRTSDVLRHVEDAQRAGATGLLLAPVSYQKLTQDDVFELFRAVTANASVPVIVYDNPGTTHFTFTDELYGRVAELPGVASIKIPGVPLVPADAEARVREIRAVVPAHVTIGVSGDAFAAAGLAAGCDAWYSVLGGTLPEPALRITRLAQAGEHGAAVAASTALEPLWSLFAEFGSLRVVAAIAEQLGLAQESCLPLPVRGLSNRDRTRVAHALEQVGASVDH